MNGYNFTHDVRLALAGAREEAAGLGHPYVAPEHMLLGVIHAPDSAAVAVLHNLGIEPVDVERGVAHHLLEVLGKDSAQSYRVLRERGVTYDAVRALALKIFG